MQSILRSIVKGREELISAIKMSMAVLCTDACMGLWNLWKTMQTGLRFRSVFAANKLVEGDTQIKEALELTENEEEMLEHIICQMEQERGLDRAAAIADMRFSFIQKLVAESVTKPKESREHERSQKIDRVLTGKYTAIPMFVLIMALVFGLTFHVIGAWLQSLLESGIEKLTELVNAGLKAADVSHVSTFLGD